MGPSGYFTRMWTRCGRCKLFGICYILGRAPRTKETLPDFHGWCRVTRHPRIFYRLTGCQRIPCFTTSQLGIRAKVNDYLRTSVGVSISLVLIPALQLGIRA